MPRAGERVGEQGVPGPLGEPGDRGAEIVVALVAPGDDDAPSGQPGREDCGECGRRALRPAANARFTGDMYGRIDRRGRDATYWYT